MQQIRFAIHKFSELEDILTLASHPKGNFTIKDLYLAYLIIYVNRSTISQSGHILNSRLSNKLDIAIPDS